MSKQGDCLSVLQLSSIPLRTNKKLPEYAFFSSAAKPAVKPTAKLSVDAVSEKTSKKLPEDTYFSSAVKSGSRPSVEPSAGSGTDNMSQESSESDATSAPSSEAVAVQSAEVDTPCSRAIIVKPEFQAQIGRAHV